MQRLFWTLETDSPKQAPLFRKAAARNYTYYANTQEEEENIFSLSTKSWPPSSSRTLEEGERERVSFTDLFTKSRVEDLISKREGEGRLNEGGNRGKNEWKENTKGGGWIAEEMKDFIF